MATEPKPTLAAQVSYIAAAQGWAETARPRNRAEAREWVQRQRRKGKGWTR